LSAVTSRRSDIPQTVRIFSDPHTRLGYELDDTGTHVVSNFQTGSGAHPPSHSIGDGVVFPKIKRPGNEADHSPASSTAVKNAWNNNYASPYIFLVWIYVRVRILVGAGDFSFPEPLEDLPVGYSVGTGVVSWE